MSRRARRRLIGGLLAILITILTLDALLFWIDPLGVVQARHAQATFFLLMQPHETGYRLQTGTHRIHHYTMTVTEAGNRTVPDTNLQAACTIAVIGDSLTMGIGVEDRETWVNRLAQQFDNVRFINAGRSDYSAPNILALKDAIPAEGYIWLIIENDDIERLQFWRFVPVGNPYLPATRLYVRHLQRQFARAQDGQPGRPVNRARFDETAAQIVENPSTIGFAFERPQAESIGARLAQRYDNVHLIPDYRGRISAADGHPNTAGHIEIAAAMQPYLTDFMDMRCPFQQP